MPPRLRRRVAKAGASNLRLHDQTRKRKYPYSTAKNSLTVTMLLRYNKNKMKRFIGG
jgi:hypothetical protein